MQAARTRAQGALQKLAPLLIVGSFALPNRAAAQAPESSGSPTPTEEQLGIGDLDLVELIGLKVINVTATKRLENLQEIPTSVAAVRDERIDYLRTGGADMRFLSIRVPSLTIESSFGRTFPRLYIRGLGNPDFDLNASQPVSTIVDGVVFENPTIKGFPVFDMDRIEVLRGPQGTLFGRNTPAGIVKFETRKPTNDFEGYGRFTYGAFQYAGFEGAVSGPMIDDMLMARLSVMYERRDGYVDNTFTTEKNALEDFSDVAARFQLLFTPTSQLRALFNFHAHTLDGTARVFRANIIEPGTDNLNDNFDRFAVQQDGQNQQNLTQYGLVGDVQYDFGPVTLISITGYETIDIFSRGDIDGGSGAVFLPTGSSPGDIPFPSESADAIPDHFQVSEEIRIATNDWDYVNFQAGFFYFHERLFIESLSFNTLGGGVQDGFASQRQTTDAWALFASATYDVIEDLRIGGGVRYSNDEKDFLATRTLSPFGAPGPGRLAANPKADFVSWDGSVRYRAMKDVNVYGRVASGFRAPSIQGRVLFGDTISIADSEKILSVEAGVKSEFLDNRVRVNAAGYYYALRDQQLTAVGGVNNFNELINADNTLGYGFELDGEAAPIKGLFLNLGFSYNHTEIQDPDLALAPCGAPCTVLDDPGPTMGTVLINGNPLPHAPKIILNASARYDLTLDGRNALFFFTNWSYRSRVNFFLYESEEFTDAAMILGDLRVGWTRDNGQLEMSAYVSNILDDNSRTGGIDFNNLTGFVMDPRIWGLEARMRY
ncbi:MAG: TonB-dependent receptor [Deltaproteobacteria bacterium]